MNYKHFMVLIYLLIILFIPNKMVFSDPFDWDNCEKIEKNLGKLNNKPLKAKIGCNNDGYHKEIAVMLIWKSLKTKKVYQQLVVREMADSFPDVYLKGEAIIITWQGSLFGSEDILEVKEIWKWDLQTKAFVKVNRKIKNLR